MTTSSNGNIFQVTGPLWGESIGDWWLPLTKASDTELLFSLICCAWTKDWAHNRDASDLGCHHAHYDVTEMMLGFGSGGGVLFYRLGSTCMHAPGSDFEDCISLNGFLDVWSSVEMSRPVFVIIIYPFALYRRAHRPKTCWILYWGIAELLSLKPLDWFALFKVLWNCLDL